MNLIATALERELVTTGGVNDLRRAIATSIQLMLGINRLVVRFISIAEEQKRQLPATQASLRQAMSGGFGESGFDAREQARDLGQHGLADGGFPGDEC